MSEETVPVPRLVNLTVVALDPAGRFVAAAPSAWGRLEDALKSAHGLRWSTHVRAVDVQTGEQWYLAKEAA